MKLNRSFDIVVMLAALAGAVTAQAAAATIAEAGASPLQLALGELRREAVLPCDTWVALPDATASRATVLVKNSDRTVFDCQPLFLHPRRTWPAGSEIDLGRTRVPQVAETYATLGSSPYWCWGYEEGINEFGVAIGNEGLFTRGRSEGVAAAGRGEGPPLGPTGMDLLRMALERSRTAQEAVRTIGSLLEEHGQFGSGMPMQGLALGAYDNSYIVADASEAWVVETCGRTWVARRVHEGTRSISNVPSIGEHWDLASAGLVEHAVERGWWPADDPEAFDFARASLDPSPSIAAQAERARTRAACSSKLLAHEAGGITTRYMMRIARDRSTNPSLDLDVTASSCIAILPKGEEAIPVFYWCAATPSNGCYVPFFVHGAELPAFLSTAGTVGRAITPPSRVAKDEFSPESYWWRFRELCDLVREDYAKRNPIVRAAFDPLEREFEAGLPAVIEVAGALRGEGRMAEAAAKLDAYSRSCVGRVVEVLDDLCAELRATEVVVAERLLPYVGQYRARLNGDVMEILAQSDALSVRLPDGRVFDLLDENSEGRWVFALTDVAAVSFELDDAGAVLGMRFHQGEMAFELERVDADG